MFSVVYCGLYTIVSSIQSVGSVLENDNDQAIILAASALLVIIGAVVVNHVLIKHATKGWSIVIGIAALMCGFGSMLASINPFGSLLVIAGLPGIILSLDPSRSPLWARMVFGVEHHHRVLVSIAVATATGLIFADFVSMYFCQPTTLAFSILLVVGGLRCIIGILWIGGTNAMPDIPKFGKSAPLDQAIAVLGVFSWAMLPIMLLVVMKVLAVFSTFGAGIGYAGTYIIEIAVLAAAIATLTFLSLKMDGKKVILPLVGLGCGVVFGILLVSLVAFPTTTKGIPEFIQRLAMLFSMPLMLHGIYAGDVPALRTTFLNALRTIAVLLSSVGVVIAVLFYTENEPLIFNTLFYVMVIVWIAHLVLGVLASKKALGASQTPASMQPISNTSNEGMDR